MWDKIKRTAIEQVVWAEKNLKGKNGAEKKKAVIEKLDEMIVLPSYLEWVDDMVLSWLVDTICEKLNFYAGHDFGSAPWGNLRRGRIADEIANPVEEVR